MGLSLTKHPNIEMSSVPNSLLEALRIAFSSNTSMRLALKADFFSPDFHTENWLDKFTIKLVKGSTNTNYLIQSDNLFWLARPASYAKQEVGIFPNKEKKLIKKLSCNDLAPKLICATSHWLILEWISGVPLDTISKELFPEDILFPLSELISNIHRQPLCGYSIDLKKTFERLYLKTCAKRRHPRWLRLHKLLLNSNYPTKSPRVFDHMDVHLGNLIAQHPFPLLSKVPSSRPLLMLIDWEYAGDINQHFALLSLFNALNLTPKHRLSFLKYYYSKISTNSDTTDLNIHLQYNDILKWQMWYDYLVHLWYEVRWHQTQDDYFLQNKPKSSLALLNKSY